MGLSWRTAGESHGPALVALLEGLPAGLLVDLAAVQHGMGRRWKAYGRGPRAKIEQDRVECLSGLKRGVTLGSPLALLVHNSDTRVDQLPNLAAPRPGHADLAGVLRNRCRDVRAVLERASARETAARVALGEVVRQLLALFEIEAFGYVTALGGIAAAAAPEDRAALRAQRDRSVFFGFDTACDAAWRACIEAAAEAGDSVGGVVEVQVWGCPPGLGGTAQHSDRLDARLMAGLASLPAIKGVEIGLGFRAAELPGSAVHDEIVPAQGGWAGLGRSSNRIGGVEGGYSNGQVIRLRAAMKPIPTMRRGAASVDLEAMQPARATYERSDVCAVPAASVAAEAVVLLELASALRARLGGVSVEEMVQRWRRLGREERPADWPEDVAGLGGHAS
ncbi:MAG: chorismate synthase [Planctomycetota bacterium]|nr:MAG: chorismate synthase [Planctomycetota bacterium]